MGGPATLAELQKSKKVFEIPPRQRGGRGSKRGGQGLGQGERPLPLIRPGQFMPGGSISGTRRAFSLAGSRPALPAGESAPEKRAEIFALTKLGRMRIMKHKDDEGNKTGIFRAKRAGGWWKPATGFVWIAHPGVARLTRAGRQAPLPAGALMEARRGAFRPLDGAESGWYHVCVTRSSLIRGDGRFLLSAYRSPDRGRSGRIL